MLQSIKSFFIGIYKTIEYAQTKRAEAARRYWGNRWY
jgi:hypothetical protein